MIRRPPRSTRTDTLFPYTTLFRSGCVGANSLTVAGAVPESSWRACTRGGLHRLPVSTRWQMPPGHREAGRIVRHGRADASLLLVVDLVGAAAASSCSLPCAGRGGLGGVAVGTNTNQIGRGSGRGRG